MSREKPSIPKGTRDFLPSEMMRRKYIFNTIESCFQTYGFQPIETPAMEHTATLLGKYGEEGDKLLFRILNSGDFTTGIEKDALAEWTPQQIAAKICDKGLRYDLTVPFARFVVQHLNELSFPFRRYQIQAVWRADKPQKGRYREFYQCDADVIGSTSMLNEAELVKMVDGVFKDLGLNVIIRLNNRKILAGLAEYIGHADKLTDITVALDKLDKIGWESVTQELTAKGIGKQDFEKLLPVIHLSGGTPDRLNTLQETIGKTTIGSKGLEELRKLFDYIESMQIGCQLELDISLARGLDYYTGTIIEVVCPDHVIGSLCGGGRYDDLTGIFGMDGLSGVGISFGADRIYDTLLALNLFPEDTSTPTRVLFVNFGGEDEKASIQYLNQIRALGIPAEIYPEAAKLKKQLSYANSLHIPYAILIGEEERISGKMTLKDMNSGSQSSLDMKDLIQILKNR